jgi:sugar lactone lactonase YvrE
MTYEVAVRAEAALGEGPTWDGARNRLIWVDILGSRVHTYDPATGRRTVRTTEQHVGAAKPRTGGGLVLNLRDGVALLDPDGTMRYDEAPGGGTLTRLTGDGTARPVLDDVTVSNGTGWSPDGRLMYYIDTPTGRIDVFDHEAGRAAGRRPFARIEDGAGFPDGLTVDADGCVWVALWEGAAVRRYTPDGRLDRVIELPVPRVTACAFGGADLTDLYITTARTGLAAPHPLAGSLFVVPGAGRGLPQPAFAG